MATRYHVGYVLSLRGQLKEAFVHLNAVYEFYLRGLRTEDKGFQNVIFHLANVQRERGMFQESTELFQKLYDIQVTALGRAHRRTKGTLAKLKQVKRR